MGLFKKFDSELPSAEEVRIRQLETKVSALEQNLRMALATVVAIEQGRSIGVSAEVHDRWLKQLKYRADNLGSVGASLNAGPM